VARDAGIPVVILSAHSELKAVTRTMQAREVWQKSVTPNQLLRALGDYCRGH
jgi:hypothetical protein